MDLFEEAHSKSLLTKEWLVKVDASTSKPYLFKCHVDMEMMSGCFIITDTKNVWSEVLTQKRAHRRFKDCNTSKADAFDSLDVIQMQRHVLELISSAHRNGSILDASFEIVESKDADIACELDFDSLKWRWDCYSLGWKSSAEVLSKHLIMPLISVAHLAFYSADPLGELSEKDLQDVVDKIGRSARRAPGIHVRQAISKPRVSTTLQRTTSLFNFVDPLPSIISDPEKSDLEKMMQYFSHSGSSGRFSEDFNDHQKIPISSSEPTTTALTSSIVRPSISESPVKQRTPVNGSETEQESDEDLQPAKRSATHLSRRSSPVAEKSQAHSVLSVKDEIRTDMPSSSRNATEENENDYSEMSDSPAQPAKKMLKVTNSVASSSDSEDDRGRGSYTPGVTTGNGPPGKTRGVRQPIKRGGKRF